MAADSSTHRTTHTEPALLGIYLNDHLAGATGGVELARRAAAAHRESAVGTTLARLAEEVAEDRAVLLDTMRRLGVPARQYKAYAAWAAEKVGRLKPNGHLLNRSPLSTVVEVEALRLGVEGKGAMWRTLRSIADHDGRLDSEELDRLIDRARRQADTLEELRVQAAASVFGG